MQFFRVFYALMAVGICSAFSTEDTDFYNFLSKRNMTPNNTCGNVFAGAGNNYTCDPNLAEGGGCCSQSGWCGMLHYTFNDAGLPLISIRKHDRLL